jgi:tRNA threonylcarbamoyladenosine biosynthesis protein TsaE
MNRVYNIATPQAFHEVVEDILAWQLARGSVGLVIALSGDLGAGKTAFTQVFGCYLGVQEPITSPTFTIMKQYELEPVQFDALVHIDAYRLESEAEAKPLRLEEVFATPRTVVCVEWSERIPDLLPKDVVTVQLVITEGETRQVTVTYPAGGSGD